jgi:hypothetical protein
MKHPISIAPWCQKPPSYPIPDGYPLVNVYSLLWKIPPVFSWGKSTISTGPFSIANCNKLPEGIHFYIAHYIAIVGIPCPHDQHPFLYPFRRFILDTPQTALYVVGYFNMDIYIYDIYHNIYIYTYDWDHLRCVDDYIIQDGAPQFCKLV